MPRLDIAVAKVHYDPDNVVFSAGSDSMKRVRRPVAQQAKAIAPPPPTTAGSRRLRWAVSFWVVFHFAAVIAAAGSVGPTSDLILAGWRLFRPYLQFFYLNHGYNFFAPQPVPSTLLYFEVVRNDGSVVRGRIPEAGIQPRLLYHRYLLLTEHIGVAPADLQPKWYKSYARHLCRKYGAKRVSLTRLTHFPPTMEMVRNGTRLDEPRSYEEMFVGDFSCSEF
jgi:hypothetical protein